MKAAQALTTLSAAAASLFCAAALLPVSVVDALSNEERRNLHGADEDATRELMAFTLTFKEECLHKPVDVCIAQINKKLQDHPTLFENRKSLNFEVNKIREKSDEGYNLVSLRMRKDGLGVAGILGDGMVWYPYQWCLQPNECYDVGPWDCDVGIPLSAPACCNMIKASVPEADYNGNFLDCYTDYPAGSVENPIDYGRVTIHTDAAGIVVHIPMNE